MPRPYLLHVVAALALAIVTARNAMAEDTVTITRAVAVRVAEDTRAMSVSYDFNFPGRERIYIDDLGSVPNRGSFSYITRNKTLVFRDAASAEPLKIVEIKETVFVSAKPPLNEIPDERAFGSRAFKAFMLPSSDHVSDRIDRVLVRYFKYEPSIREGVTEYATTYAALKLADGNGGQKGRIALIISLPHDVTAQTYKIRVRELVEEGRVRSMTYKATDDTAVLKAGGAFVDTLMRELLGTP